MSNVIRFPTERVTASGVDGGSGVTGKVLDLDDEKAYRHAAKCERYIKEFGSVPYNVLLGEEHPEEKIKSV